MWNFVKINKFHAINLLKKMTHLSKSTVNQFYFYYNTMLQQLINLTFTEE